MLGFLGERVLVNGMPAKPLRVPRGPHRLRVLNGSNSRIYDLAWSDGSALTLLGTDGGLLPAPRDRSHVVLAPGQRLDIWANFGSGLSDDVWLESRAFEGAGPAMRMAMGSDGIGVSQGQAFRIQRFVASGSGSQARPPPSLASAAALAIAGATSGQVKLFPVQMGRMRWLLNGRPFEMRDVIENERVRLGTVEDWEFSNPAGPMAMAHPIHLHGSQFRILQRQSGPGAPELRDGIFDEGWQDTFLLLPGDRVRVRKQFDHHLGLFLYHCHNLEHEDMGMMRNFLVEG